MRTHNSEAPDAVSTNRVWTCTGSSRSGVAALIPAACGDDGASGGCGLCGVLMISATSGPRESELEKEGGAEYTRSVRCSRPSGYWRRNFRPESSLPREKIEAKESPAARPCSGRE